MLVEPLATGVSTSEQDVEHKFVTSKNHPMIDNFAETRLMQKYR
jgi:hypothetical protein